MNYAVVIYHKNVHRYPPHWIEQCLKSLEAQTDQNFSVWELNYSGGLTRHSILQGRFEGRKHFYDVEFTDHSEAMNYIYSQAFLLNDVVFNVNIDDYYHPKRIEEQKKWLQFYDIVSSNYKHVVNDEQGKEELLSLHVVTDALFRNHNVVSNPCHAMHKRVFEAQKFDSRLIPYEDLEYWKLAVRNGFKIGIIPQALHYYRIHGTQVGKTNN